ncbi:MAG TPA: S16 family serine protease [Nitrospirales bacterium]|jgi:predicted S18 family serine protease
MPSQNRWQIALGLSALIALGFASAPEASEQRFFISISTLAVSTGNGSTIGSTGTWAIEIDRLSEPVGLIVQFNEGSRVYGVLKGRALEQDSKEAARTAVLAACSILEEDPRTWRVTFKEVSNAYLIGGPSAGGAIAVALIAAVRGASIIPGVVMTGAIDDSGRILAVGDLPAKIQAAAAAGLSTVLIPEGQARTRDWDLWVLSESLGLTVVEVSTVKDAYEKMTGRTF